MYLSFCSSASSALVSLSLVICTVHLLAPFVSHLGSGFFLVLSLWLCYRPLWADTTTLVCIIRKHLRFSEVTNESEALQENWKRTSPDTSIHRASHQVESSWQKKICKSWWTPSWPWASDVLAVKKANDVPGSIRGWCQQVEGGDPSSLNSWTALVEATLESCGRFWAPQ